MPEEPKQVLRLGLLLLMGRKMMRLGYDLSVILSVPARTGSVNGKKVKQSHCRPGVAQRVPGS